MRQLLESGITKAEAFLTRRQLDSGEFATYRYNDPALQSKPLYDPSPFVTTFVLAALSALDSEGSRGASQKAIDYLVTQREDSGLWRYWSTENAATIEPDVDVTCCAAAILRQIAPDRHVTTADAALLDHRTLRGLFKTWFRPGHAPNDIALGVNANALHYFGEREETQRVIAHINTIVNADQEEGSDWYYPEPVTIRYLVSRAYHSGVRSLEHCRESILQKTHHQWSAEQSYGNELATALSIGTLLNFSDADPDYTEPAARELLEAQREDGSWPAYAFYAGPEPPGPHAFWWGSEELTTAIVLDALCRLRSI